MACPYFFPTEKNFDIDWAFPHRLPLGTGFSGLCMAGNTRSTPTQTELKEFCNLGYAGQCPKLPAHRHADSVRFSRAATNGASKDRLRVYYSCEQNHSPVEHGVLEYDRQTRSWQTTHPDPCIQRQAECYVEAFLERRTTGQPCEEAGQRENVNTQSARNVNTQVSAK